MRMKCHRMMKKFNLVMNMCHEDHERQKTLNQDTKDQTWCLYDMFDLAIARFFLACGISFNASRSPYFEQMVHAINNGPMGYKPPSYEKLRAVLVDKVKNRLEKTMALLKGSWSVDGCSIIMDGWTDCRNHPLINIIISSITGPYFLRPVDCSGQEKNVVFLKDQLCDAIDEVGPSNVIQVVTDATLVCRAIWMMAQKEYKLVTSLIFIF